MRWHRFAIRLGFGVATIALASFEGRRRQAAARSAGLSPVQASRLR